MAEQQEPAGAGTMAITELENDPNTFQALFRRDRDRQAEILGGFSPQQQQEIRYKQKILTSLATFIGKDFGIPVKLNEPGEGWHWNFQENEIKVDPKDLLEKPLDYLRFVTSHEGSHRRISRAADIPQEVWKQPGFSFMANAIEDPRVNNFLVDAYPKAREQMQLAYETDAQFEAQAKKDAKDQLGFQPRFVTAGFEYIKQWFRRSRGEDVALSDDLAPEVRAVVEKTLESARDAWLRYPSKKEADQGEELIRRYAQVSYEIQRDEVWPEFRKLVDADMQDQEIQELMQQMMQQGQSGEGEGEGQGGQGVPQDLQDKLTEGEKQELEQAMQQAQQKAGSQLGEGQPQTADGQPGQGQKRAPVDLDSLSPELKQKMKDYIDSQPQPTQQQLAEMARQMLKELEDMINEQLQGKLSDNPDRKAEREAAQQAQSADGTKRPTEEDSELSDKPPTPADYEKTDDFREFKDQLEQVLQKDEGEYEQNRREVLPIIDALEGDLRELFVARRANKWQSGFRIGKRIDIKKRMQEKALGISAVESKAWQKRELPQEKDYAVTLLVDLSGSMGRDGKIQETFKGAIVLAEVLNRLSINTEILGFNDRLYEYQAYGQDMSQEVRDHMGTMPREVHTERARYNDDGWALQEASERLARQKVTERFLFVLSDGAPEPSAQHTGSQYELGASVRKIMSETDQKLIGLGIGQGTDHVTNYYPNSIANINVYEMAEKLADVIREAIANYDTF